jgi:alpha-L-fucosidase
LIRNLIDIVSKGGNYLLNVGPTAEGEVPAPSVERLAAIGKWLKVNGDAVYGTSASPFAAQLPWGRATRKAGKLYLHVFNWPADGRLEVPPFGGSIASARLMTGSSALDVKPTASGFTITVPAQAPDPMASVIVADTTDAK